MAELIQYANGVPGIRWPLDKTIIQIGRSDKKNDIAIDDAFASKTHAQIEIVFDDEHGAITYYIRDLGSTNHTYLNQTPVEHHELSHNDTVVIGKSKFVFIGEGVREYISMENLLDSSAAELASELEESLSIAVDEITEVINRPESVELAQDTLTSITDGSKFSRRLNIY